MFKPAICSACLVGLPLAAHTTLPQYQTEAYTVSGRELEVFEQADRQLQGSAINAQWTYEEYMAEIESALKMTSFSENEKIEVRGKVSQVFELMDTNTDQMVSVQEISYFITQNKADTSFMLAP